jgi:hypothetical protein
MNLVYKPTQYLFVNFESEFTKLKEFSDLMEKSLLDKKLFTQANIDNKEKDKNVGFNEVAEDLIEISNFDIEYPVFLRYSIFSTIYSYFEHSLSKICSQMQFNLQISLKKEDLRGNGINQSRDYLKKVIEIEFPDDSPLWQEIQNYRNLRNNIIHNKGLVSGDVSNKTQNNLNKYIESNKYLDINYLGQVELSKDFILEAFNNISLFWDNLTQIVHVGEKEKMEKLEII